MVLLDVHVCIVECILVLTNLSLVKTATDAASLSGIMVQDIWKTLNYNIYGKIEFRI